MQDPTFLPSGNILDLMFTSEVDRVGELAVLSPFPGCGHCPLVLDYIFMLEVSASQTALKKLWTKGKYDSIDKHIWLYDWNFELAYMNVNEMFLRFSQILQTLVDMYVPLRRDSLFW